MPITNYMKTIKYLLLIKFYWLLFSAVFSQDLPLQFKHLKVEDGLSQTSVFTVLQDSRGYIWLGTRDGLNKYDSKKFSIYRNRIGDFTSIDNNQIYSIYEDEDRRLFIGTRKGVNEYNYETNDFKRISYEVNETERVAESQRVTSLVGHKNQLWIAHDFLKCIDKNSHKTIYAFDNKNSSLVYNSIKSLFKSDNNVLWIGTTQGLFRVDNLNNPSIRKCALPPDYQILSLEKLDDNYLLLGTRNHGLVQYNIINGGIKQFTDKKGKPILSNINTIRSIYYDATSNLIWIGTFDGLYIHNLETNTVTHHNHSPDNPTTISNKSIYSIIKDKKGSFWIGTYHGGINFWDASNNTFKHYTSSNLKNSLSHHAVSAIIEDANGSLWIGTEGGGINYFDRKINRFTHFKKNNDPNSISSNNIKTMLIDSRGDLWIGTYLGGLNKLSKKDGVFINRRNSTNPIYHHALNVYSIIEDGDGTIWIGSLDKGLFSLKNDSIKNWSTSFPSINTVRDVMEDSKGNIWVSTQKSVFKKDFRSNTFNEVKHFAENKNAVEVYCLEEDSKGNIWAGTYGKGLLHLNNKEGDLSIYNVEDGLPGNNIFGIMEDNLHNLWLTTNNGLSKFNPDNLTVRNYGVKDGLLGLEASYNSYCIDSSGEMFFGGIWGLTSFHPSKIAENDYAPQVVLTGLTLFNHQVNINDETNLLAKDISITESISFQPNQNNFTIEFAMLNYVQSDKNTFAYRLNNFEKEWNIVARSHATYTNLVPGEYTFQVKGANNDGKWNHIPTQIKVIVLAPWWKRPIAYLAYFIIISIALFGVVYYSKQRLRLLHSIELERVEKEKKEEMHQLKLQYFTNISHEIRTPMTLIAGPVEELLSKGFENAFLQKNLRLIKANVQHIQKLIDQLLDFRKQETGNLKLAVAEGNITNFIREITLTFKNYASQKGIYIEFKSKEDISLWYDRDQLEKVLYNLLSNALKYGNKNIEVNIYKDDKKNTAIIEVINDGIGIRTEEVNKIFERYYMVNHSSVKETSTGIGLALVKGIIDLHHGKISVESAQEELNHGNTKFTIELPLGRDHFTEEQIIDNFESSESINQYYDLHFENNTTDQITNDVIHRADIKKHTILIVEDNKDILNYLQTIFEKNYHILKAENGREGLYKAKEELPDLIISDVMMPELDGHELSKFLKSDIETSHIPIILLTARTNLIQQVAGLETGADDYITKPFNILLLKTKVKNLIKSRDMMRNIFADQIYLQPKNITITPPDEAFLSKALETIENNLSDSTFNVNVFVKEMGMSRPVLFRKIKALTNLSIVEFIISIRLKRAAQLIKESDLNVNEIAFQVGYDDPKYFSKSFKKQFNCTPTEYKKDDVSQTVSVGIAYKYRKN